jgi:hypothetical protein
VPESGLSKRLLCSVLETLAETLAKQHGDLAESVPALVAMHQHLLTIAQKRAAPAVEAALLRVLAAFAPVLSSTQVCIEQSQQPALPRSPSRRKRPRQNAKEHLALHTKLQQIQKVAAAPARTLGCKQPGAQLRALLRGCTALASASPTVASAAQALVTAHLQQMTTLCGAAMLWHLLAHVTAHIEASHGPQPAGPATSCKAAVASSFQGDVSLAATMSLPKAFQQQAELGSATAKLRLMLRFVVAASRTDVGAAWMCSWPQDLVASVLAQLLADTAAHPAPLPPSAAQQHSGEVRTSSQAARESTQTGDHAERMHSVLQHAAGVVARHSSVTTRAGASQVAEHALMAVCACSSRAAEASMPALWRLHTVRGDAVAARLAIAAAQRVLARPMLADCDAMLKVSSMLLDALQACAERLLIVHENFDTKSTDGQGQVSCTAGSGAGSATESVAEQSGARKAEWVLACEVVDASTMAQLLTSCHDCATGLLDSNKAEASQRLLQAVQQVSTRTIALASKVLTAASAAALQVGAAIVPNTASARCTPDTAAAQEGTGVQAAARASRAVTATLSQALAVLGLLPQMWGQDSAAAVEQLLTTCLERAGAEMTGQPRRSCSPQIQQCLAFVTSFLDAAGAAVAQTHSGADSLRAVALRTSAQVLDRCAPAEHLVRVLPDTQHALLATMRCMASLCVGSTTCDALAQPPLKQHAAGRGEVVCSDIAGAASMQAFMADEQADGQQVAGPVVIELAQRLLAVRHVLVQVAGRAVQLPRELTGQHPGCHQQIGKHSTHQGASTDEADQGGGYASHADILTLPSAARSADAQGTLRQLRTTHDPQTSQQAAAALHRWDPARMICAAEAAGSLGLACIAGERLLQESWGAVRDMLIVHQDAIEASGCSMLAVTEVQHEWDCEWSRDLAVERTRCASGRGLGT